MQGLSTSETTDQMLVIHVEGGDDLVVCLDKADRELVVEAVTRLFTCCKKLAVHCLFSWKFYCHFVFAGFCSAKSPSTSASKRVVRWAAKRRCWRWNSPGELPRLSTSFPTRCSSWWRPFTRTVLNYNLTNISPTSWAYEVM